MQTAKDLYIELMAQGYTQDQIDDELLCKMMDEEWEALELQRESMMDQLEHTQKEV